MITATDLRSFTTPGAQDAAQRTYASIKAALSRSPAVTRLNPDIFLQGSYANDTNTRGDSDVDIVVMMTSAYMPQLTRLTATEQQRYERASVPATTTVDELRSAVTSALTSYYGAARVHPRDKCIRVDKTPAEASRPPATPSMRRARRPRARPGIAPRRCSRRWPGPTLVAGDAQHPPAPPKGTRSCLRTEPWLAARSRRARPFRPCAAPRGSLSWSDSSSIYCDGWDRTACGGEPSPAIRVRQASAAQGSAGRAAGSRRCRSRRCSHAHTLSQADRRGSASLRCQNRARSDSRTPLDEHTLGAPLPASPNTERSNDGLLRLRRRVPLRRRRFRRRERRARAERFRRGGSCSPP
jgi:predicted nucleotidyltransferase